jgi:hypothetical protein
MDIEAGLRRELIDSLHDSFLCFEEVEIEHPMFSNLKLRADVVAVPIDERFWGHALAFEVKCFDETADYADWSGAVKQASDYVLGRIRSDNHNLLGRRVSAAFVYPAPRDQPYVPKSNWPPDISMQVMTAGVFHCAIHWRVGRAHRSERDGLVLSFGPNELWTRRWGFSGQSQALLTNRRRIGSRGVDICAMLDGFDSVMPELE